MKILLIEDDPVLSHALELGLRLAWPDVQMVCAADGEAGVEAFYEANPDVVLLDVGLPGENGFEVLREIRRVSDVPVIMLTARRDDTDQVRGLELGADDYVVKPFSRLALMARIRAVRRRYDLPPPLRGLPDFEAGDLVVHFGTQQVTLAGEPVRLTPIEYRLLYHLVRHAGQLMPHAALLDRVWGSDASPGAEHLKVFVSRVRAKLRQPGGHEYIRTERRLGYRFVRPPADNSHWPGATVLTATDGEHGLSLALHAAPDVVILDLRLPDRTGLEVLSRLRESSDVPVILLTAVADELDHVHALELGADDYLVKPFGATALLAHIQAVLRRARGSLEPSSGKLRLDAQRRELVVAGQRVPLSGVEFRLLAYLLRQAGHAVERAELIRCVWGGDDAASDHDLSVFIARLRAKLAPAQEAPVIVTERGVGYRVVAT